MASWKKQKKLYGRPHIVDWDTVIEEIFKCEEVGWSWFEELKGVHHTGIVIYLDFEARYTINWAPKTGTKIGSLALETEGQLVFEDERVKDQDFVDYKECLEKYDMLTLLHGEDDRPLNQFFSFLEKLCCFNFSKYENKNSKGDAEYYDITSCNCRDHVESVLRDILAEGPFLYNQLQQLQEIRKRRSEAALYKVAAMGGRFISAFGGILSCWDKLGLDRFVDKWKTKAEGPFHSALDDLNEMVNGCLMPS